MRPVFHFSHSELQVAGLVSGGASAHSLAMALRLAAAILSALLGGCSRADRAPYETPAQAYRSWDDRFVAATGFPLPWRPYPCSTEKTVQFRGETFRVMENKLTDQCVHMTARTRWRGVWKTEFEGSQFCPGARSECSLRSARPWIWMNAGVKTELNGKLYRVEFEGRRTRFPGGYGHMGEFDHEIIVDRMISIEELPPSAG